MNCLALREGRELPRQLKGGMCVDLHSGKDSVLRSREKATLVELWLHRDGCLALSVHPGSPCPEEWQSSDVFFSCRCYRNRCPSGEMSVAIAFWWVCCFLR